jgi:hypothetical protein
MGYLKWKEAFLAHCATHGPNDDASYFEARIPPA